MDRKRFNFFILRVVTAFWLLGWFIKLEFFNPYLTGHIVRYQIVHELFPPFFLNSFVAQIAYFLPFVIFILIFFLKRIIFKFISIVMVACSLLLCWHADTYNDATFVTSFWVGLWVLWFSWHLNREDNDFYYHASLLSKLILSLVFLGGFAGKLTPEYWQGEAPYELFFQQNHQGIFAVLKQRLSLEEQLFLAKMIGRMITGTEGLLSLAVFLPSRFVYAVVPFVGAVMVIFRTWAIISVLACLVGLSLGCYFMIKRMEQDA